MVFSGVHNQSLNYCLCDGACVPGILSHFLLVQYELASHSATLSIEQLFIVVVLIVCGPCLEYIMVFYLFPYRF